MQLTNLCYFFFFNDTATTEIYTLSLHDALPISLEGGEPGHRLGAALRRLERPLDVGRVRARHGVDRSEEHTSELQSQSNLVCRLLLEKKKKYANVVIAMIWSASQTICTLCAAFL